MGLIKKVKGLQAAFEQGVANANAAAEAMNGTGEPAWLLHQPLRGPAGQYVYGQHLPTAERDALLAPVVLAADPAEQRQRELDAREATRAPHLAQEREALRITRIATTEGRQVEMVAEHLARTRLSARPDLVFGLYRVPDHIDSGSLTASIGSDRLVEWEIVHRDVAELPAAAPPTSLDHGSSDEPADDEPAEPTGVVGAGADTGNDAR